MTSENLGQPLPGTVVGTDSDKLRELFMGQQIKKGDHVLPNRVEFASVRTATGAVFALTFIVGLPPPSTSSNLYLLTDGSLAMGVVHSDNGKQWLRSFNPAGITPLDISADKILGWAPAGPRRGVLE